MPTATKLLGGLLRDLIAMSVRSVGRKRQREAEDVGGKRSPDLFRCQAPVDQKNARIGRARSLEYHLVDAHRIAVSKAIFGRHAEYSQDGGSVHAKPCRTGGVRERRIVNTGDVKRHAAGLPSADRVPLWQSAPPNISGRERCLHRQRRRLVRGAPITPAISACDMPQWSSVAQAAT